MDYRELLKKYMMHVRLVTDEFHLDTLNIPGGVSFDLPEEKELREIQIEASNEHDLDG